MLSREAAQAKGVSWINWSDFDTNTYSKIMKQTIMILGLLVLPLTGQHIRPVQPELANLLQKAHKAERGEYWSEAMDLYSQIQTKYPNEKSDGGSIAFLVPFKKAQIYAEGFDNLDSSLFYLSYIVREMGDTVDGGYEHESAVDIKAVSFLARTMAETSLSCSTRVQYLESLRKDCKTASSVSFARIEISSCLFELGQEDSAKLILLDVIHGPKARWGQFKSSGDFRWSAIRSLGYLFSKYVDPASAISVIEDIEIDSLDQSLQFATVFTLAELYEQAGNEAVSEEKYLWCKNHLQYTPLSDYWFSFSPHSTIRDQYWFRYMLNERF